MSAVEGIAEVIFVAVRAALYGPAAHCQEGFVELAVSGLAPMYPASGLFRSRFRLARVRLGVPFSSKPNSAHSRGSS
jgi:hypothetical protein